MIDKIKEILLEGVNKKDFPGASFCLTVKGETKCDFVGYSQIYPTKILLNERNLYDVASLSKVIVTTILIFKLIELNKLTLDTKVSDVLEKYKHEETTISDLLLHTSGLPPIISNNEKVDTKKKLIEQIYDEKVIYEPRSKIVYSDIGFKLLGFIVEKVTKEPLNIISKKMIFDPLCMNESTYNPRIELAVPTERISDGLYVKGYVHDERSRLLNGLSGHAGLFSTAPDIAKFMNSILYNEKVISNKHKELIFNTVYKKQTNFNYEAVRTYGFQKFLNYPSLSKDVITHTGFTGCNLWIDKKREVSFVLLSNAIHPRREENKIFGYRNRIFNLFYKEENK